MSHFSTVKYLGVLLDSNLSWKFQINNVPWKISRTVGCSSKFDCNIHCKTIYFVTLACFSVILIHPHTLFSDFTILSVMTAVTFPRRPPRVAFAICGRRWQNDVYENKVYFVAISTVNIHNFMIIIITVSWHSFSLTFSCPSLYNLFF